MKRPGGAMPLPPGRRAGRALALWLLLMLVGALLIARTPFRADLSAFLPSDPDPQQRLLVEQLQSGVAARTLLIGLEGGDAATRAAASRRLAAVLRESGRFEQVQNGDRGGDRTGSRSGDPSGDRSGDAGGGSGGGPSQDRGGDGGSERSGDRGADSVRDAASDPTGGAAANDWQAAGTWLVDHRYLLSPAVTPERFTAAGLREALDETLSLLGTPAGALVKPLLARDPTGETQRIAEALIPASAPRSEAGVWASREAPRALLLATTRAAGADLDGQAAALSAVREAFAALQTDAPASTDAAKDGARAASPQSSPPAVASSRKEHAPLGSEPEVQAPHGADVSGQAQGGRERLAPSPPALRLLLSGPAVFSVESRALIEREVKELAAVGLLAVGGLLLLAFASLRALAVALLPVATGIVAGVAAVGVAFGSVHGFTLAFGSTLIGEAVDYAIYYLIQARAGAAPQGAGGVQGEGWQRWRRENWPTVRLGLLTSVCGFGALVFSGFPGLAQLGVFSVAGLCGAALATRWLLPALVSNGASGEGLRRPMSRLAAWALRALPRLRGPILVLGVAAAVLLALRWDGLWRADLGSLSPVPPAAQALDERLRADLGASDAGTLVVANGADVQAALRGAEAAGARLEGLVEQGLLAGYESPARLLPSLAAQQARQASLPERVTLQARLAEATQGGPLPAARLQPFVDEVQAARTRPLLDREALRGSPLAPAVDALLFERAGGGWSALLALQPGAAALDAEHLRAALAGLAPAHDLQVVAVKRELDGLYDRYLREALLQALAGGLAVVALLAVQLRSPRRLLAVCQPLVLAVLLTLGGLALAGTALGILHLVGLLLVVAIGSNYALFFDRPSGSGAAAALGDDTLASLLLANATTVVSFGLIALSDIAALSAIGRVVAPGALLALLLAAAFARAPAVTADRAATPAP